MTIEILFITKNQHTLRFGIRTRDFYCDILYQLPVKDIENWIADFDNDEDKERIFTDHGFITRVWCACARHGHIPKENTVEGKPIDKMKFITQKFRCADIETEDTDR